MAPLIDVVFLLLVFFMLTSSFTPPSLPLVLPKSAVSNAPTKSAPVISVDASGRIAIDGETIKRESLADAVKAKLGETGGRSISFRGDSAVDYGEILDLMNRTRAAGAEQINLIYEVAPQP